MTHHSRLCGGANQQMAKLDLHVVERRLNQMYLGRQILRISLPGRLHVADLA